MGKERVNADSVNIPRDVAARWSGIAFDQLNNQGSLTTQEIEAAATYIDNWLATEFPTIAQSFPEPFNGKTTVEEKLLILQIAASAYTNNSAKATNEKERRFRRIIRRANV